MYSRRSSRLRLIGDPRELSTPCWLRGIVSTRCIEIGAWGRSSSTRGWGRLALRASKRGSPLSYQASRARDRLTCRPARPLRPPVRAARRVLIGGVGAKRLSASTTRRGPNAESASHSAASRPCSARTPRPHQASGTRHPSGGQLLGGASLVLAENVAGATTASNNGSGASFPERPALRRRRRAAHGGRASPRHARSASRTRRAGRPQARRSAP